MTMFPEAKERFSYAMKLCPICATSYPAGHRTCPTHGAVLVDTPELPPGTMIRDCYRIERTLGKGGMGIVYLAEHTLMGEPRALKFLSGALASNPTFVQRFLQEARAANKLRHPNIAQTLELGQSEDGSFYISMEFVDGPSLRALLDQSPLGLPPERAFGIVRGVAEALGAAHAKHMVHRDIKPENILLAWTPETETAKVVDFGIVAITDSVGRLTQTGRPLMTAQYAAPEQWRGTIAPSELDGRTDLYSLGCMFFEMLTGQLPFYSETYEGWFEQHVHAVPQAPSQIRPSLAQFPGLDALVLKLLAKEREDRPANVKEFLAELDRAIVPSAQGLTPSYDRAQRTRTVLDVPNQNPQFGQSAQYSLPPQQPSLPQGFTNTNRPPVNTSNGVIPGPVITPQPPAKSSGLSRDVRIAIGTLGAVVVLIAFGIALVLMLHKDDSSRDDHSSESGQSTSGSETATSALPKPQASQPEVSGAQPDQQFPASGPDKTQSALPASTDASSTARQAIALYNQKQYTQSEPLFEQACNGGHADSCDYLGWMYQYHLGVNQDYPRAVSLFDKGCKAGSLAACNNEGVMYQDSIGVTQDYERAVLLYTRACDGNFAIGCDSLGYMYQFKEGVPQDYSRAVTLYTKACNGDSMNGCKNLGWMYQYHLGVDQDYPRAVSLYTKACDGDNFEGCNNLGYMYQHSLGVNQDYQLALTLYNKACNGNEPSACNSLGVMYEEHEGVPEDDVRAVAYYTKACDAKNANGCSDLGNMYRSGKGVAKDTDKARALLTRGCNMGSQWGCDNLKEMH